MTERTEAASEHHLAGTIKSILQVVVLFLLFYVMLRGSLQNFTIEGSSMEPDFHNGEGVIVDKLSYARVDLGALDGLVPGSSPFPRGTHFIFSGPTRGDVIVFRPPVLREPGDFIKRIIGVPGDRVDITDGVVYVNDAPFVVKAVTQPTSCAGQWCHLTLGPQQYFVMGDNRGGSFDSRAFGPVTAGRLVGRVWLVWRPLRDFHLLTAFLLPATGMVLAAETLRRRRW